MTIENITQYILENFEGIHPKSSWGETSFFYNPNKLLPNGVYFCTIKDKDGANDKASHLARDEVFRLSIGISKSSFKNIFNIKFKRPLKGEIIQSDFNFEELDTITPHPIYGWMSWICILNPSKLSFENTKYLLDESYQLAVDKFDKKLKNANKNEEPIIYSSE